MFDQRNWVRTTFACLFALLFAMPSSLLAQDEHIVSPSDLQAATLSISQVRQQNIQEVQNFLSSDIAKQQIERAHLNPEKVKAAVATLSDQELADLAARSHTAEMQIAGGLSVLDKVLIIAAVAVIIIIIVVKA
jgi:hypothetical protein